MKTMETKSIEERATLDADKYVGENGNFGAWQSHRLAYIRVATEQDRIARQEEKDRCIEIAMKFIGALWEQGYFRDAIKNPISIEKDIREAIEEGGAS